MASKLLLSPVAYSSRDCSRSYSVHKDRDITKASMDALTCKEKTKTWWLWTKTQWLWRRTKTQWLWEEEPRHGGYGTGTKTLAMEKNQSAVVRGRGTKTQWLWEEEPRHGGYGTGTKTLAMEKNQSAVVRGRGTKTQWLWRRTKMQWLWNRNQDTGYGEEPKCSG